MADVQVNGQNAENAILLLEAAEKLDLAPGVVRTTSKGHFLVPEEVAKEAGLVEKKASASKRRTARGGSGEDED